MKLLAGLLLAILFLGASADRAEDPGQAAWFDACNVSRYYCGVWARPAVIRAPLIGRYGQYSGGDVYIVVNDSITDPRLLHAVSVHEMIHYLQWRHGIWKQTPEMACFIEHEAFDVSNKVLAREGAPEYFVNWNTIARFYGCPVDPEEVPDGQSGVQSP